MSRVAQLGRVIGIVAVSLLFAGPAAGDREERAQRRAMKQLNRWWEAVQEAERAVRRGESRQALESTEVLLAEMVERIQQGRGAEAIVGSAVLVRALARAGEGDLEGAQWDFWLARSLRPEVAGLRFETYGDPGLALASAVEPETDGGPVDGSGVKAPVPKQSCAPVASFVEPFPRESVPPAVPSTSSRVCIDGPVAIRFVVDAAGVPRLPEVAVASDPVLGFVAAEALRAWRFDPATCADRPIAVAYSLDFQFEGLRCASKP